MTHHQFLQLNILWPAVAAVVNRDGNNAQKTTLFAGTRRARWSSQSQKRSTRHLFRTGLTEQAAAVRTRVWDGVADALANAGWADATAVAAAKWVAALVGGGDGAALVMVRADFVAATTQVLLAHGPAVIDAVALAAKKPGAGADPLDTEFYQQVCLDRKIEVEARFKTDKAAKKNHQQHLQEIIDTVLSARGNVDIAFNGRMIAENDGYNIDAAVHVGHAIGVDTWEEHAWDYFTAVDDLAGTSGMLGTRPNGTALYFRTATIDLAQAHATLGGDWDDIVTHTHSWADAFCRALPSSMQSSTAATSAPVFAAATASPSPMPNLASFCATPITGKHQYERAAAQLLAYHESISSGFGPAALTHYWTPLELGQDGEPTATAQPHPTWADALRTACTALTDPGASTGA